MKNICIIGMGNMGQAIFEALCIKNLYILDGCGKEDDVNSKLSKCDTFLIAVKPKDFEALASQIKIDLSDKLCISIMAGVSLKKIQKFLKIKKVVRCMPNLPLKVGASFTGWICSKDVNAEEKGFVKNLLMTLGDEIEVTDEDKINMITALSGSGPAYYYFLNQCLAMKALEFGFSHEEASKIARGTFFGACELLKKSDECSGKLIQMISSKGGTTEAALNHLKANEFEKIFMDAVKKAYKRAKELNN